MGMVSGIGNPDAPSGRETIVRVLRETGGVLSGPGGAAARLGLKRTTLQSRMQKLGISREEYENQQCNKEHEN
jgi:formate hydrogenlyase transcriptional activator